jgi:hypothetical protein
MSYRRFDFAEIANTLAAVATVATVRAENLPNVANFARVANSEPESRALPVRSVATVAIVARPDPISDTDADLAQAIDEREAMAIEGEVPAAYARAFAELQVCRPAHLDDAGWARAIDDAGRFLDAYGQDAVRKGWTAEALLGPTGLIIALRNQHGLLEL